MSIRFQRLIIILLSIIFLFSAILLILFNYNKNIVFFYTPSELFEQKLQINTLVRIGGFVKKNSLILQNQNNKYSFVISDKKNEIKVEYDGILPDLFKENNGAVIEGKLVKTNEIVASKVFAKHDENYMPASIKKELEKTDYWKKNY
tara:strand:+ start:289 stop:729 length:441 start_codon:yes stop_codon:yes gene_type:complete